MTDRQRAIEALAQLVEIVEDTVREGDRGQGVPNGPIYAALMSVINLDHYNMILDLLVRQGKIRKTTEILYWKGAR